MSRRFIAPFVVAAAVAGGGVAGAVIGVPALSGAQESTTPQPEQPDSAAARTGPLTAAAAALGLDVHDLLTELRSGKTIAEVAQSKSVDVNKVIDAMVAEAVKEGRDEAKARTAITKFVNEGRPEERHRGPHARRAIAAELDAAAQALGMERSALVQELKDGKTIAEVAKEKNVDVDEVIDAMVGPVKERITKFVNEGGRRAADGKADTETD